MVLPLAHLVCLLGLSADPRPLPAVIADLGSPDYSKREAATDEVTRAGAYSLVELETALKDKTLTPEQRLRLEGLAFRTFADSPRGALGVQFSQNVSTAQVESVRDKFPAAATLKKDDIITQIDGVQVTSRIRPDGNWSTVRALIISHDPGDNVPVIVQRAGVAVPLIVKLGEFKDLGGATAIYSYEFHAAWQHRLQRNTGEAAPKPIDASALRPRRDSQWSTGEPIDLVEAVSKARAATGEVPSVSAGACPDQARQLDSLDGDNQVLRVGGGGLGRAFGNNPWGGFGNGGRGVAVPIQNDQRELSKMSDAELAAERLRLGQWLQSFAMIVGDGRDAKRGDRKQIVEMQNQTLQQLSALTREVDRRSTARRDAKLEPAPVAPQVAPAGDDKPDQKADKP